MNLFDHPVYGDWAGHAPLLGYDLLDGPKKRLHTNFQVSASLSKKVLIFFQKKFHVNFSRAVEFFQNLCRRALNVYKNISKELCDSSTYIATKCS